MDAQSRRIRYLENRLSSSSQPGSSDPVVSGIYALPVELLIKIFHCVVYSANTDVRGGCLAIITLSHVCRDWRSITLDVPRLWCNIWTPMQLSGVEIIVKRSKYSPLNIHCDISSDGPRTQVLTNYIARSKIVPAWKNLSWTSPETAMRWIVYLLNSTKITSFPNLVSLDLSSQSRAIPFSVPTAGAVDDFPALTHIRLARVLPV